MYQLKETYPIANAMFVLLTKNYPGMRRPLSRYLYKISIMGTKDGAHRCGSLQMGFITIAQCI